MGCDFSLQTKQDFMQRISSIKLSSESVKKSQKKLKTFIKEFDEITSMPNVKTNIGQDLEISLKKLEELLKATKEKQKMKSSDTIPILIPKEPPKQFLSPEKRTLKKKNKPDLKLSKSHEAQNNKEKISLGQRRGSVPKNNQQSILDDPEIVALITKNKQLLMRQLTR